MGLRFFKLFKIYQHLLNFTRDGKDKGNSVPL
jgi:hypothetical protein